MESFEKISKMNLADLDRPGGMENADQADAEELTGGQESASSDGSQEETGAAERLTVADVEGTDRAGTAGAEEVDGEVQHMRQPEGKHYYIDARITEKELLAFLFGHNYRQPLMLIAIAIAVIWPVTIIVRGGENMYLAIALAAIVLLALPLSNWTRGKKAARTNPSYQQTFHYMLDEWGMHLELGDKCIDLEWNKICKCMFLKSATALYTGKSNAFLIPTAAMGSQTEEINTFIREMRAK